VQTQSKCVGSQLAEVQYDSAASEILSCNFSKGLAEPWTNPATNLTMCQIVCPHPLYSAEQYTLQRRLYLFPAWIGGLMSVVLVLDAALVWRSSRPEVKSAKKANVLHFQLWGGVVGSLYLVVGPVFTTFAEVSCADGAVIPQILYPSWAPSESVACTLNRGSIYLPLAVMNLLIVTLIATNDRLAKVHDMGANKIARKVIQRASICAVAIPTILLAAMYSLDKLDKDAEDYQGQIARWTVVCGPRLTVGQEMALMHVPLILCAYRAAARRCASLRLAARRCPSLRRLATL
jgi:hypothetical protein